MTPKEYKQMMDYLTRSGIKDKVKFASDIARPDPKPVVQEIEAINEFVRRNPRADGGRIGFLSGGDVERIVDIYNAGLEGGYRTSANFIAEQLGKKPGEVSTDIVGRKINELIEDGTLTKQKELKTTKTKGKRKIYKVARPIETRDRINNPDIPKDAKFKMQVPGGKFRGEGSSTTIIYDTTKEKLNERLKKIEGDVYVKPSKPKEPIPDDKFLVKKSSKRIKENINEIEYEEVLGKKNFPKTFKPTGKIIKKYKPFIGKNNITIPGKGAETLKEAEKFVKDYFKANPKKVRVKDPKKDYRKKDIRRQFEKDLQGRTIQFGAPKGYSAHHMLPLAGKADVTDSDIAIISNKMNAEIAQFDKPMNALVNEAYALDFSKEGSLKRMDEINKELADIVKKAETKLPKKYKGLIGFNKLTPVLEEFDAKGNQVFDVERIGADYKKSIGGKKTGTPLRDLKTSNIRQMVSDAPTFKAKIPGLTDLFEMAKSIPDDIKRAKYLKAGFKTLGVAAAPLVIYDTYKAFEQGKPILEALEQGFIGTDLIGGTKRVLSLTPEEREARSVVKQDALKDLNLDMPMGFGFIEGPTPDTDMTLQEAQQKMDAGIQRVRDEEAQKNLLRSRSRGFGTPVMADQFLAGGGIAGLSGGKKSGPPPISGPTPDGDEGLPAAFKNVRNI